MWTITWRTVVMNWCLCPSYGGSSTTSLLEAAGLSRWRPVCLETNQSQTSWPSMRSPSINCYFAYDVGACRQCVNILDNRGWSMGNLSYSNIIVRKTAAQQHNQQTTDEIFVVNLYGHWNDLHRATMSWFADAFTFELRKNGRWDDEPRQTILTMAYMVKRASK